MAREGLKRFVGGRWEPRAVERQDPPKRRKFSYLGAPAAFKLELACTQLTVAFEPEWGCYLVGSVLERPDWRDVDVRMLFSDEQFEKEFPGIQWGKGYGCNWEFDPKWQIMTISTSAWLAEQTGLPIDFQFWPISESRRLHDRKIRNPIGRRMAKREDKKPE